MEVKSIKGAPGGDRKHILNVGILSPHICCVLTSFFLWRARLAMYHQVVQVQPESWVQEEGQWSTGLCECYKDVGDCEYSESFSSKCDTNAEGP